MVDEQCVDAGFADQQGVFEVAVHERSSGLVLVRVEFSEGAFVDVKTYKAAEIAGTEPGLVLQEEGVEVEFVAGENMGNQVRVVAIHRYNSFC